MAGLSGSGMDKHTRPAVKRRVFVAAGLIAASLGLGAAGWFSGWHSLGSQSAGSKAPGCRPINAVPYIVRESGSYCLATDIGTSESGIVIRANFVTIDLQGHTLAGPVTPRSQTIGILGQKVSNVRIENGTISGFTQGIVLSASRDWSHGGFSVIDRVEVKDSRERGISLLGNFNEVSRSSIHHVGGEPIEGTVHNLGVVVTGYGAVIRNNRFSEIRGARDPQLQAEGIALALSGSINGAIVEDNVFENVPLIEDIDGPRELSPSTFAIWFGGKGLGNVIARKNTIRNYINGIASDYSVGGIFADNDISETVVPITFRDRLRKDNPRAIAGAGGYVPDPEGRRPAGVVSSSNNSCAVADKRILGLARQVAIQECVGSDYVSYDDLLPAIENVFAVSIGQRG